MDGLDYSPQTRRRVIVSLTLMHCPYVQLVGNGWTLQLSSPIFGY